MIVVVDANIILSGVINPYGPIPEILLQKTKIDFIFPGYALEELHCINKGFAMKPTPPNMFLISYWKNC